MAPQVIFNHVFREHNSLVAGLSKKALNLDLGHDYFFEFWMARPLMRATLFYFRCWVSQLCAISFIYFSSDLFWIKSFCWQVLLLEHLIVDHHRCSSAYLTCYMREWWVKSAKSDFSSIRLSFEVPNLVVWDFLAEGPARSLGWGRCWSSIFSCLILSFLA